MENQGRMEHNKKIAQTMEFGITCVVLFFLVSAETALSGSVRIFGAAPLVTLAFCVCLSLQKEPFFAVSVSALCGVFLDLAKGVPVGIDSLLYTYISVGCIWLGRRFYFRKKWMIAFCVFCFVLAYGFISSVIQGVFIGRFTPAFLFGSAVYSAALTPMLCACLRRKEV